MPRKKGRIWDKVNIVQIPLTAQENNIYGKVKTVRYADYEQVEKNGRYERVLQDSGYNVYDVQGHLVDQNEYDAKGKPKWKCIYKYDANGRAIGRDFTFTTDQHNVQEVTIFIYDENGRKVASETSTADPDAPVRSEFRYDDRGNEIEEVAFRKDKSVFSVTSSKYDSAGNQVAYHFVSRHGEDSISDKRTAEYDAYGNKTAAAYYMGDVLIGRSVSINDNRGRCTETRGYTADGKLSRRATMKYDDRNNITEAIFYTATGAIDTAGWNSVYEFEYDTQGNKTKETHYRLKNDKRIPATYTEAVYTYYE